MNDKINIFVLGICLLSLPFSLIARDYDIKDPFNPNNSDRKAYIQKYKKIAIEEMARAGIPASIKLAQGILESGDGKSSLATKANNHFGMKCGSAWKGGTYYLKDDDYDANGNLIKSCFRAYEKPEESYTAHSEFLRDPRKRYRYGSLFSLQPKDYKAWAYGLKKAGYATNPRYPQLLIGIIEANKLYQYDDMADLSPYIGGEPPLLAGDMGRNEVVLNNGVRMVLTSRGDTPESLGNRFRVSAKRIIRYNELPQGAATTFADGSPIYLQPKRKRWRGKDEFHPVQGGETMHDISQLYGIRLKQLYKRNRMEPGTQPAAGEKIALRRKIKAGEPIKLRDGSAVAATPSAWPSDKPFVGAVRQKVNAVDMEARVDAYLKITDAAVKPDPTPPDTGTGTPPKPPVNPDPTPPVKPDPTPIPPKPAPKPQPHEPTKPPAPTPTGVYHTVASGDTLYGISRKYGVTVDSIKKFNNLKDNSIKIGQRLRVK